MINKKEFVSKAWNAFFLPFSYFYYALMCCNLFERINYFWRSFHMQYAQFCSAHCTVAH